MSRPRALTPDQVQEIKDTYAAQGGRRGIIASLSRSYGVSRKTIQRALDSYVTEVGQNPGQNPRSGRSGDGGPVLEGAESFVPFSCGSCGVKYLLPYPQTEHTKWCPDA